MEKVVDDAGVRANVRGKKERWRTVSTDSACTPAAPAGPAVTIPTIARRWAALLILVMVALAGLHLWSSYQEALRNAERLVDALTRSLSHQVETSLRAVDALTLEISQRVDPDRWPDAALVEIYRQRLAGFPEIRNLVIIGRDGQSRGGILSTEGMESHDVAAGDRQYFRIHQSNPRDTALNVGDPIISRLDNHPVIPLSRAMVSRDGRLRGVVVASLESDNLTSTLANVLIEDAGGASIIRGDGLFLARLPDPRGSFGRSTASSPLFRVHLAAAPNGVARFVSVTDGNAKIVGFRTIDRYPVVATVGVTEATALADFHRRTVWIVLVVGGLAAALFRLAWLSDRREYSRALLAARLERQSRALEEQVAERTSHLEEARAAAELRSRQQAQANADLEQFAHVAAHDLQEPLRSVAGFVQLLQHRYRNRLDAEANDFIFYAVEGVRRMQQQILDLMAFSQIRSQGGPFLPAPLSEIVEAAKAELAEEIREAEAKVVIGPLPILAMDRPQMVTLFRQLLSNAVKFQRPDVPPKIEVGAELSDDGEDWVFWVRDDGIGIDPQYAERIFEMFQKLHTRDHDAGTGIGLTLCRRIVERRGGRIWADCRQEHGVTFRFTLPVTPPEV